MNIESMRIRSYRSFKVDEHVPAQAAERYRTLRAYAQLRLAGCGEAGALAHIGISRRTLYRWKAALAAGGQRGLAPKSTRPRQLRVRRWTDRDVKAVMDMRRKYPFMGKARIQGMLERRGVRLSVSTVGRILERALAAGAVRARQPLRPSRVLEPLQRTPHRHRRRPKTQRLRVLLQLSAAPRLARLSNPQRVPCANGGRLTPQCHMC